MLWVSWGGGLVRCVLVENGDQERMLMENITQESIQKAIFYNIDCKQFFLVEAAPICTGNLCGILDKML